MSRMPIALLAALLVVANLGVEHSAHGQRPPRSAGDDFSHSATLPQSRDDAARLTAAQKLLAAGDAMQAIPLLQRLLDADHESFLTTDDGRYQRVKDRTNRLLADVPRKALDLYERQYGPLARKTLQAAWERGNVADVIRFIDRYRHTRSGGTALRQLQAWYFDRGEFQLAAAAMEAALDHPRIEPAQRRRLIARLVICRNRLGDHDQADWWLARYRQEFGSRPLVIAGKAVPVSEWSRRESEVAAHRPASETHSRPIDSKEVARTSSADKLPAMMPEWSCRFPGEKTKRDLLAETLAHAHEQGIPLLSHFVPITVDGIVVAHTNDRILALDVDTGERLWQTEPLDNSSQAGENSERLNNPGFRSMMAESIVRQVQSDTLYTTVATDGRRVFAVEPGRTTRTGREIFDRASTAANDIANLLTAYDLKTGELLWRLGEPEQDIDQPSGDVVFLSTPLPYEDCLYILGQVETALRLFAIDPATGALRWSIDIADVSRRLAVDRRRRGLACSLAAKDELLICPTAAGAVVAVDLLTRTRCWAFRYARDDMKSVAGFPPGRRQREPQRHWSRGWRDVGVAIAGRLIILASPESDSLYVLDRDTGQRRYERPKANGLMLAGVSHHQILILERNGIRSRDLNTGQTRWFAKTGPPAGKGFVAGTDYYVPGHDGRVAAIELTTGAIHHSFPENPEPLGSLLLCDRGVLTQTQNRMRLLPFLAEARARVDALVERTPDDTEALLTKARLDREAGDFRSAAHILRRLNQDKDDPDIRRQLLNTLLVELRQSPQRRQLLADAMTPLLGTVADRVEYLHALAQAAGKQRQGLEALTAYFELLGLNPAGDFPTEDDPRRLVRYDRQIQGEIADLFSAVDPADLYQLTARLDRHRQAARDSQDPFALQRFADRFSQLPWGQRVRTTLAAQSGIGVGFIESQLSLLELSGARNRRIAAAALERLAQLMADRSYRGDAARYYQQLKQRFPDVRLAGGRMPAEILDQFPQDSLLVSAIRSGPREAWPDRQPAITTRDHRNPDSQRIPVPVEAPRGSLLDRLSVSVDRKAQTVRFQGTEYRRAWELPLTDPASPFRVFYHLHRGWGLGQLLILQLGSDLFAISPLDENGETNPRVLWTLELLGETRRNLNQFRLQPQPARSEFGEQQVLILDGLDRPTARVGPVRPGYLCYRTDGKLIAVETATGHRLWTRQNVPADASIIGDEDFLAIYQQGRSEVEVLRALDGKTVHRYRLPLNSSHILTHTGCCALVKEDRAGSVGVRQIDLADGRIRWSRDFVPGTRLFPIDDEIFGVLEPETTLQIQSMRTGKTIAIEEIKGPKPLERVIAISDTHRIYLLLSGPLTEPTAIRSPRVRSGWRHQLMSGPLYCFDRQTGRRLWSTSIEEFGLPLDQPVEAPFLILTHRRVTSAGNTDRDGAGVLRCIDKRSGRTILEMVDPHWQGEFLIETRIEYGRLDLKMPNKTIRFDLTKDNG